MGTLPQRKITSGAIADVRYSARVSRGAIPGGALIEHLIARPPMTHGAASGCGKVRRTLSEGSSRMLCAGNLARKKTEFINPEIFNAGVWEAHSKPATNAGPFGTERPSLSVLKKLFRKKIGKAVMKGATPSF